MTEPHSWASSPGVRSSMKSNRGRDTGPELALRRVLHARGLRFYLNRRPLSNVRRTADILFPRCKVAVYVDGCFWHGCPEHHTVAKTNAEFWADKVEANRRRDLETTSELQGLGWSVVRVWEYEDVQEVADRIDALVRALRRVPEPSPAKRAQPTNRAR